MESDVVKAFHQLHLSTGRGRALSRMELDAAFRHALETAHLDKGEQGADNYQARAAHQDILLWRTRCGMLGHA